MPNFSGKVDLRSNQIKQASRGFLVYLSVVNKLISNTGQIKPQQRVGTKSIISSSITSTTPQRTSGQLFP